MGKPITIFQQADQADEWVASVYQLSEEDKKAIEDINKKRQPLDQLIIRSQFCSKRKCRITDVIFEMIIKFPYNKEYYDALDKIKPFSEREAFQVWQLHNYFCI